MAIVVVGGHTRNVGKTSVAAGLIAALPEFNWTALKITQYGHGVCSSNGQPCDCATDDHSWAIAEERDRTGETDTSRFLVSGAQRAWWVRTQQGRLAEAMNQIRACVAEAQNAIIESNSILKFIRPDLYLTVLDPAVEDFKASAQQFLDRADAVVLHDRAADSRWDRVSLKTAGNRPVFKISPPPYVTPEIVDFVKNRLLRAKTT